MAAAGNIYVGVIARTKQFQQGMQGVQKRLKRVRTAASRTRSAMNGMAAGLFTARRAFLGLLGALGAGGGLSLLVKSQMKAVDSLEKTSQKLGIQIGELSKLQYAAQRTGVSIETFNMALQRSVRRIAEAAKDTGEAKDAIKELGLDAKKLVTAGPAEAFRQIADAMLRVDDQAHRVRLAMKLFDSEGVSLVNTLAAGRAGLDAYGKKAEDLGLVITDLMAAKIVAANDAIADAGAAFAGLGRVIAVQLAPYLKSLAEQFVALAVKVDWGAVVKRVISFSVEVVATISDMIDAVVLAFKWIQKAGVGAFATVLESTASLADGVRQTFIWMANFVYKIFQQIQLSITTSIANIFEGFDKLQSMLPERLQLFGNLFGDVEESMRDSAADFEKNISEGIGKTWGKGVTDAIGGMAGSMRDSADDMQADFEKRWLAPSWGDKLRKWSDNITTAELDIKPVVEPSEALKEVAKALRPQALTKGSQAAYSKILELTGRGAGKIAEDKGIQTALTTPTSPLDRMLQSGWDMQSPEELTGAKEREQADIRQQERRDQGLGDIWERVQKPQADSLDSIDRGIAKLTDNFNFATV